MTLSIHQPTSGKNINKGFTRLLNISCTALVVSLRIIAASSAAQAADNKTEKVKKPNFLWLLTEDNYKGFLKLYDPNGASMPNIEGLAKHGLVFNNAFSNAPVCSVARSTLATGAYGPRIGTQYHRAYKKATLPDGLKPISLYMKDAGYYTSNDVKKDYNFVEEGDVWNESKKGATWRNRKPGQPFFHMQSWTTTHEKSLHFPLSDVKNKPTIHDPKKVKLWPIYPDTEIFRYTHARYLDNHVKVDEQMGEVIQKLKDDGLLEDTFIFYFGDHGGVTPATKGYIYERGLHVPLVVRIPENFKHLMSPDMRDMLGGRINGFVQFIDFAPTIMSLAGVTPSKQHDGKDFLGKKVKLSELEKRDTVLSYADRFDEKFDKVRAIRKGKYKYIRFYEPFNADALYNQYRYRQEAYKEWKQLYKAGKLNNVQANFFKTQPAEVLYDINKDPFETKNLAQDKKYADIVKTLRNELTDKLVGISDLAFYPESWQNKYAAGSPVKFGQEHKQEIAEMIEIANLEVLDFKDAKEKLAQVIHSKNKWHRYWGLIALTSFGKQADGFTSDVLKLMEADPYSLNRARAIQFLAMVDKINPSQAIEQLVANTEDDITAVEILNIATQLHDIKGHTFNIADKKQWAFDKKMKRGTDYDRKRHIYLWTSARREYLKN